MCGNLIQLDLADTAALYYRGHVIVSIYRRNPRVLYIRNPRFTRAECQHTGALSLEVAHPIPVYISAISHVVEDTTFEDRDLVGNHSRVRRFVILYIMPLNNAFHVEMILKLLIDHYDIVLALMAFFEDVSAHAENPLRSVDAIRVR